MINTICVAGAGTMGRGIAQVCAQNGFSTLLFDSNYQVLEIARKYIINNLGVQVTRQKITADEANNSLQQIEFVSNISECIADFFIEAIIENIDAKVALFNQFAAINQPSVIFASNTSSLSISLIQQLVQHPERVAGMHFFNPAPVMKLVEVIPGNQTSEATKTKIYELSKKLGKVPIVCKNVPGFIVNRVARQYYLEAMQIVELGFASIEDVDEIMESNGFKMGPFRLMDLIGIDVNLSVSQSIYNSLNEEERLKPSGLQIEKVKANEVGQKTGKGFYSYT